MSKELQDRADKIVRDLKDALVPLKEELEEIKGSSRRLR